MKDAEFVALLSWLKTLPAYAKWEGLTPLVDSLKMEFRLSGVERASKRRRQNDTTSDNSLRSNAQSTHRVQSSQNTQSQSPHIPATENMQTLQHNQQTGLSELASASSFLAQEPSGATPVSADKGMSANVQGEQFHEGLALTRSVSSRYP
jgi:hypothetical protein